MLLTLICLIFSSMLTSQVIFDFNKHSNIEKWVVVDDEVMGGRSLGNFSLNEDGHGVFEGEISMENNGGFSSVRYRPGKIEVNDHTKAVLRLKGDSKKYQFRLKADAGDAYSYVAAFQTSGEWQEIEIPLKDMYPSFRGRRLEQPNFSAAHFEEIGILIGNKKKEKFRLLLDKIELR